MKSKEAENLTEIMEGINQSELVLIIDNNMKIVANTTKAIKSEDKLEIYTRSYYIKGETEKKSDSIGIILVPLKKMDNIQILFGRYAKDYLNKSNCAHMYSYVLDN